MKIGMIGTGYVGLVTGVCLSEIGHTVWCMDIDKNKIAMLANGRIPFFEPGLEEMLVRNRAAGRLLFTTRLDEVLHECGVCFIAVGTPMGEDGAADLCQVVEAAKAIGKTVSSDLLVVLKSTVPAGTTIAVRDIVREELVSRKAEDVKVDVVFNPEFLREGAGVQDFFSSDRIIIGTDSDNSLPLIRTVYASLIEKGVPLLVMDMASAELAKYAANTMLASRISLMNELSRVCDSLGADIKKVQLGIGTDMRIGPSFLNAGIGYGGSCFPKDVNELLFSGQKLGVPMHLTRAIDAVNHEQSLYFISLVTRRFGDDLAGRTFGVWGLTFKPDSDDMREAVSLRVLSSLLEKGARVNAFDPLAPDLSPQMVRFDGRFSRCQDPFDAAWNADALILITEWDVFKSPDFEQLAAVLRQPIVFDGRNQYDPVQMQNMGFEYYCIGRSCIPKMGCFK